MSESEFEREEEEAAAAEAAGIGGRVNYDPSPDDDESGTLDPAKAPLIEAGEGESEGFELAEHDLEDNASHGDLHSAGRVLEDASLLEDEPDDSRATTAGEADEETKQDS
jgi:hypothetical protein